MAEPERRPSIMHRKPLEAVEGALPARLSSVCLSVLAGTLTALVLGSKDILAWVNNLPIGEISDFLLLIAQNWHDTMVHIRVTGYADTLHKLLEALQSLRWTS